MNVQFIAVGGLCVAAAAASVAAQPRVMRPEDLFRVERIGAIVCVSRWPVRSG